MNRKIILASGSPRRREILQQVGISFEVRTCEVEETYQSTEPEAIVKELALKKADAVWELTKGGECIVIGADTVVVSDGCILGKPKDAADAFGTIKSLQGRSHQVYTGTALVYYDSGVKKTAVHAEMTTVYVQEMDDEEIAAYVATKEPEDKAGSYGIQGGFAKFIKKIEGDYYNVVGLTVSYLYQKLKCIQAGF